MFDYFPSGSRRVNRIKAIFRKKDQYMLPLQESIRLSLKRVRYIYDSFTVG